MISLIVHSSEEYRRALPETGLFDIFDCELTITTSPHTSVFDIDGIVKLTQACIHVTDVDINLDDSFDDEIHVTIAEVPLYVAEKRDPPKRGPRKS